MSDLKQKINNIIFGHDTKAGKLFDLTLLAAIVVSVVVVCLESVASLQLLYGNLFRAIEWGLTILFTIEYGLRIYSAPNRLKYVFSFLGIIDLLSILPTYLSPFVTGAQSLIVVRALRLLRVFRVMKLVRIENEGLFILKALRASRFKVFIFTCSVLIIVVIMGTLMHLVEGEQSGFDNIPRGIYWAIVTLTTVGYGDITPQTPLGQAVSAAVMVLGYAIIAVPTGIVTSELTNQRRILEKEFSKKVECSRCGAFTENDRARYCFRCGEKLPTSAQ